jgi:hypothetical protein
MLFLRGPTGRVAKSRAIDLAKSKSQNQKSRCLHPSQREAPVYKSYRQPRQDPYRIAPRLRLAKENNGFIVKDLISLSPIQNGSRP